MPQRRLLLMSNSRNAGQEYLEHAIGEIRRFLGSAVRRVLFIPYAAVRFSFDEFAIAVAGRFHRMGYALDSIHTADSPAAAVGSAEAIVTGGGNTFHLLSHLYQTDCLHAIRSRVDAGVPYIGWSAGSNVACPTIKTTNDMPIVQPPGFAALGLVPFQINPHYLDVHPDGHQGETREERLLEFVTVNPGVPVVGLREGSMLRVEDTEVTLTGTKPARVFVNGEAPQEYPPGRSLDFLLSGV
jgi:dipeptidase E